MGDGNKRVCRWRASLPSSSRLLLFMAPLVMGSVLIGLLGYKASDFSVFSLNYYSVLTSSSPYSAKVSGTNATEGEGPVSLSSPRKRAVADGGLLLDLQSTVTAVAANHTKEAVSDDSFLNRSASPPLAILAIASQQPVAKMEENLNITTNGSLEEPHALPTSGRLQRECSNLKRLEAGLGKARAAITEAKNANQTHDPDYVPMGPIYWNPNLFHRSYLEMEKQFKVFVYEEGEPPIFHHGPCKSTYAMEGIFISDMESSQFRTRDPEKAHVYFLPLSVTSIVHFVYDRQLREWFPMRRTVIDYVNLVSGKYPYWNRSFGADHFMLACHDWGPELSFSIPELYRNSIRALCNANTSEGFNPSKDVSFPEILLTHGTLDGLTGGPSPSRRPYLVFFAGGLHGPIRPVLLDHWENKDEDVQVHKYLPKGVSYYGMLRKSRYCICPSGYEVASPRMVEALYTGCVPVLIKDHYVPPFSDVLNWKSFSVEIPVKDIPNLKKILMGISSRQYIRMQRRGVLVRRHFEVNLPPKRYDVFHMILHSVWLRRLNIRIHGVADS